METRAIREGDVFAMQRLASSRWPFGYHPGGLGWEWAIGQLPSPIVVCEHAGELLGWAGLVAPTDLVVEAGSPAAAGELLAHVDLVTATRVLIAEGDRVLAAAVRSAGFASHPDAEPWLGMVRPVEPQASAVAPGFSVRAVEADEAAARVQVHRQAWRPADLPYAPGSGPAFDPSATSRFRPEHYAQVTKTGLYDRTLDLVVLARDGRMAASCLGWFDSATKVAEIEPLGVIPEFRRLGLAGLLCAEMGRRVAALGGRELFINVGPRDDYPAPAGAYVRAGFEVRRRGAWWSRVSAPARG